MDTPFVAPRLHILLARDVPYGVVVRRGPSKHVCTVGWNRDTDTFTLGQWLKGRMYPLRSDLSPDGKHFIYFAMNGKNHYEAQGAWTALSYAPYLKAIGLWAKGDTWDGGGLFVDNAHYWLNEGYGHTPLYVPAHLHSSPYPGYAHYGYEDTSVYYLRLLRDGWRQVDTLLDTRRTVTIWEKRVTEDWILRKWVHTTVQHPPGKGCYYDEHELEHRNGTRVDGTDWEWADWDGQGRSRLLWASHGKLFATNLDTHGLSNRTELYDFTPMTFEPIKAPY